MLTLWWQYMERTFVGRPKKHSNYYFETWQGKFTVQNSVGQNLKKGDLEKFHCFSPMAKMKVFEIISNGATPMEKMSKNLHFRLVNIRRYYLSLVFHFYPAMK